MPRAPNALDLLRRDHAHVQALLRRFEKTQSEDEQRELCGQIVDELTTHADIEERIFYPYLRDATAREDLFEEATIEHQMTKDLLEQLPREQPGTPRFQAMVRVLGEHVQHHVEIEETSIFPQVVRTGVDLEALGEMLEDARHGRSSMADGQAPEEPERKPRSKDDRRAHGDADAHKPKLGPTSRAESAQWIETPGEVKPDGSMK